MKRANPNTGARIFAVVTACALFSCAGVTAREIGRNSFEIAGSDDASSEFNVRDAAALRVCPEGYESDSEVETIGPGQRWRWRIICMNEDTRPTVEP
jgi:hypothetical protein